MSDTRRASSQTEVRGETIEIAVDTLMSVFRERVIEELNDQGVETLDQDDWYPLDAFVEALSVIEHNAGASTVKKLGAGVAKNMELDSYENAEAALAALGDALRDSHRGMRGTYECEPLDDGVRIVSDTPYPCAFDQGIIVEAAKHFDEVYPRLEEVGQTCRSDGDSACTYDVSL